MTSYNVINEVPLNFNQVLKDYYKVLIMMNEITLNYRLKLLMERSGYCYIVQPNQDSTYFPKFLMNGRTNLNSRG